MITRLYMRADIRYFADAAADAFDERRCRHAARCLRYAAMI